MAQTKLRNIITDIVTHKNLRLYCLKTTFFLRLYAESVTHQCGISRLVTIEIWTCYHSFIIFLFYSIYADINELQLNLKYNNQRSYSGNSTHTIGSTCSGSTPNGPYEPTRLAPRSSMRSTSSSRESKISNNIV